MNYISIPYRKLEKYCSINEEIKRDRGFIPYRKRKKDMLEGENEIGVLSFHPS